MSGTARAVAALAMSMALGAAVMAGEPSVEPPAQPAAALSSAAAIGRDIYQGRCSNCHSIKAGESPLAPTLFGLMGRKAGGVEGFPYSEKLTHLDVVWSAGSLDAWLFSSSLDSPLLRMRHLGVEDLADREALIAYIATLK